MTYQFCKSAPIFQDEPKAIKQTAPELPRSNGLGGAQSNGARTHRPARHAGHHRPGHHGGAPLTSAVKFGDPSARTAVTEARAPLAAQCARKRPCLKWSVKV